MRRALLRRRKRAVNNIKECAGDQCRSRGRGYHASDCEGGKGVAGGIEQGVREVERGGVQGVEEAVADYEAEGRVGEGGELSGGEGDWWWWRRTKVDGLEKLKKN